jgi:hypothetical protein
MSTCCEPNRLDDPGMRGSGLRAVLISTYELGHQPFGLASPTAWLRRVGVDVTPIDLSRGALDEDAVRAADLVAFYVPMHTATRMALEALDKVRALNANAHLCFYGLYAPLNEAYLRALGADTILGGEYEQGLLKLAARLARHRTWLPTLGTRQPEPVISTARQEFIVPDRRGLPALADYASVVVGDERRIVGYSEASRGCKHTRHCPIVPVYGGRFRVVAPDVVLADVDQQVQDGAEHITFGDPDFFNGPTHAMRVVEGLHAGHPRLTYDVTIKVEHLLRYTALLPRLRDTGCLFVTTAVESIDDHVLARLEKGHTQRDFIEVVRRFDEIGLTLTPTFVAFHPWLTVLDYRRLLALLDELGLVDYVGSIQLAIRLLIPAGSKLLDLGEIRELVGEFDRGNLSYTWRHPDPRVDALFEEVFSIVEASVARQTDRRETFERIWRAARDADPNPDEIPRRRGRPASRPVPHLNEPWFCCAEPLRNVPVTQRIAPV